MRDILHNISECPFFFVHTIKPTKLSDAAKQDHKALCHIMHQLGPCGQIIQNVVPCKNMLHYLPLLQYGFKYSGVGPSTWFPSAIHT